MAENDKSRSQWQRTTPNTSDAPATDGANEQATHNKTETAGKENKLMQRSPDDGRLVRQRRVRLAVAPLVHLSWVEGTSNHRA